MKEVPGSVANPGYVVVSLCAGEVKGIVRPWTMAQRADLKPSLLELLERIGALDTGDMSQLNLGSLFSECEEELIAIAQCSVELPDDTEWDFLHWADLPTIIQAVWQVNFVNEEGLMGKLVGLLSGALQKALSQQLEKAAEQSTSAPKTTSSSKPADLPCSPDGGEPPPTSSATP